MATGSDLIRFNILNFLTSRGIESQRKTKACVNIHCPFCPDSGFHLGIFLDYKNFSCWKCGKTGSLYFLLSHLLGISKRAYEEIVQSQVSLSKGSTAVDQIKGIFSTETQEKSQIQVRLPEESIPVTERTVATYTVLRKFLEARNISVDCCTEHNVQFCLTGKFSSRLIIPVESNGELVCYQGRDMTNNSRVAKYLFEPKGVCASDFLYGIDEFRGDEIILLEGVLDQWVLPNISVACFGSVVSSKQKDLILSSGAKCITFAFDLDVVKTEKYEKLLSLMSQFLSVGKRVKVVHFPPDMDPSSLGKERALDYIGRGEDVFPGSIRFRYLQDHLLGDFKM